jgi:hypothetical protein
VDYIEKLQRELEKSKMQESKSIADSGLNESNETQNTELEVMARTHRMPTLALMPETRDKTTSRSSRPGFEDHHSVLKHTHHNLYTPEVGA